MSALLDRARPDRPNLLAFPAQSNFSGVKHPLDLVDRAQRRGWDVLLDAAAFVATNRLDLSAVTPDFVTVSFYKMFGYPTGVGCLLVRCASAAEAPAAVVRGRNGQLRDRSGQDAHPRPARSRLRGRHAQLPEHPGRDDRPASICERIGLDDDRDARALPHQLAAQPAARAPPQQRPPHGPHLRARQPVDARRHRHAQFLRSRRPPARLPARRGARRRPADFTANRLLLQPRRGRNRRRPHRGRHDRRPR